MGGRKRHSFPGFLLCLSAVFSHLELTLMIVRPCFPSCVIKPVPFSLRSVFSPSPEVMGRASNTGIDLQKTLYTNFTKDKKHCQRLYMTSKVIKLFSQVDSLNLFIRVLTLVNSFN